MSDLKVLQPSHEISLESVGETLILKPLTFGKLGKATALTASVFGNIAVGYDAFSKPDTASAGAMIARAFSVGGEEFYQLLSLATGKSREWFDELSSDDGIKLATLVIEINADFFIQKVLPALKLSKDKVLSLKGGLS